MAPLFEIRTGCRISLELHLGNRLMGISNPLNQSEVFISVAQVSDVLTISQPSF